VKLSLFLVSSKSLYQARQKDAATSAARAAGLDLEVFFAEGDTKKQRDQLFACIRGADAPAGLIVHAIEDAGLRFVAQEAARKGIAWVTLNRAPTWVADVARDAPGCVAFSVTVDQRGIGRLQGEQFRALLPTGGSLLYVTGPSIAVAVRERQAGMEETGGSHFSSIVVVGDWSEGGASAAVHRWLDTTRGFVPVHLLGAQNDDMAAGARKALHEAAATFGKPEWRTVPVTGVDGLPGYGQRLVDDGTLAATITVPATSGTGVELLAKALRGTATPPTVTTLPVSSYPAVAQVRPGR
jgi:ABC-type sugar transport system substrate-binding protein